MMTATSEETRRVRQREFMARRYADRRSRIVALKLTLSCVDCGWAPTVPDETKLLDFDHIDPATKHSPAAGAFRYSWSWSRILRELSLCVTRCKPCHTRRTAEQRRAGVLVDAVTHCLRGHEFTTENTYVRLDGRRACRACQRRRDSTR